MPRECLRGTASKASERRHTQMQIGDQHNTAEQQKRCNNRALSELNHQQGYESEIGLLDAFTTEARVQVVAPTEAGDRCFCCFVADSQPEWTLHNLPEQFSATISGSDSQLTGAAKDGANNSASLEAPMWVRLLFRLLNCQHVADCWGVSYKQRGMLGTIVYDTFGYHIPGDFQDGRWYRRRNIGYISNLAVVPGARRCEPPHVWISEFQYSQMTSYAHNITCSCFSVCVLALQL